MPWAQRNPRKPAEPLDANALYDYATATLGRRMRTVSELKKLLQKRVEPGESGEAKITAVLERLHEYKFLDDPAFAANYTRLRQENQHFGRRRIQQDLTRKGIAPDLANETLNTAYEDLDEETLARQYLARKRLRQPTSEKESARIMRQLIRAGFSSSVIFKILKNWQVPDELLENLQDED